MLVGAGFVVVAAAGTVITVVVLTLLVPVEALIARRSAPDERAADAQGD
jgi:uncharacterized membrane protein YhiD involved in acid resistance